MVVAGGGVNQLFNTNGTHTHVMRLQVSFDYHFGQGSRRDFFLLFVS